MSSLKARKSSRTEAVSPPALDVRRIAAVTPQGAPVLEGETEAALATAAYGPEHVGRQVAVSALAGDARALVLGLLPDDVPQAGSVKISAPQELVLECGRASIVLTRAGKVLIRGAYVASRSTGLQRITGAAVQIN